MPSAADKKDMNAEVQVKGIRDIMTRDVVCIDMDYTLGKAIEMCSQKRIRHVPVLDEEGRLAGIVTDRDLRLFLSPRIGTISENNADRESLMRRVHQMMIRQVICVKESASLAEAAELMLAHRVGCLPVVDDERHVVGLVTTTDMIRYIAKHC